MSLNTHSTLPLQIISHHGVAEVVYNTVTSHHSLHASMNFSAGATIVEFSAAAVLAQPTYLTIQTGIHTHITLSPSFLQFVNHSCVPNVFFDTAGMELVALKPICIGEELCFFYPSTEWKMAQPFNCNCGNNGCLHFIDGAADISKATLRLYRLTNFINEMLKQKNSLSNHTIT